ncbi:protein NKG7-like [Varanus komodoensis]|uniref:protein NKG7-like n=1 Tax=Varanus komodoensis TaxID=61221 RepID=UPI001CF7DD9D|nr:protein NKG7-like [Varanus komodoensis]
MTSRGSSATISLGSSTSTTSYPDFLLLTQPLRISSGICAFSSLLLHFASLGTSFWLLETTHKGLAHSGLWQVCLHQECRTYWFTLLAPHIHATRAFLVMGCFCGLLSLLCVCISFERDQIFHTSLTITAAAFSFSAGFLNLIAMSVFTAVHRSSQAYSHFLLLFGSSYGLGWASVPMYSITGMLLLLTHHMTIS